jgi:SAM-dependent methyltransferase
MAPRPEAHHPIFKKIFYFALPALFTRQKIKMTPWHPPSFSEFAKVMAAIYSPEIIIKLKSMNADNLHRLEQKNILAPEDTLHGELADFDSAPLRSLTRNHFNHLKFLESLVNKRKLSILDIGCGSGDFTFIARSLGHTCHATESYCHITNIERCENQRDLLRFSRWQRRQLLNIQDSLLLILPQHHLKIHSASKYDIIYINFCTIHYPEDAEQKKFWKNEDWVFFLKDLVKLLNSGGFIFITLADPCYDQLPDCLAQFYINYQSGIFDEDPNWLPLLIIKKEKLSNYLDRLSLETARPPEINYNWVDINRETFMKDSQNDLFNLIN